ncbi:MAG: hypothetical protein ABF636_02530 [Acetobacter sp.]
MKRMLLIAGLVLAGGTAHAQGQTYTGVFDGGKGKLVLNGNKASLSLSSSTCFGQINNAAFTRNGDVITITQPSEGQGSTCHVKLTVKGSKVINSQENGCMEWHGASCSFDG